MSRGIDKHKYMLQVRIGTLVCKTLHFHDKTISNSLKRRALKNKSSPETYRRNRDKSKPHCVDEQKQKFIIIIGISQQNDTSRDI